MDRETAGEAEQALGGQAFGEAGKSDEDRPWAIRGMPMADRRAALAAAKRAKKSVPVWLGEAIRSYIEQEREDRDEHTGEILEPGQDGQSVAVRGGLIDPGPPLTMAEIGEAVRIAQTVAELRGKKLPPNGRFLVQVERTLRLRMQRGK